MAKRYKFNFPFKNNLVEVAGIRYSELTRSIPEKDLLNRLLLKKECYVLGSDVKD